MAKTRIEKEKMLAKLNDRLENSKSAVLVDYKGLKVKDIQDLRKSLLQKKVHFNVFKNSLIKIAFKKHGIEFDQGIFKKPIAIAFALEDEVSGAKEIDLFAKKNEALEILGGILEKKAIDADMVKRLAALPSREELLAKMVGSIASPLSGIVNVLVGNVRGLVNVLNAYREKIA